jgi:hypothetical protein
MEKTSQDPHLTLSMTKNNTRSRLFEATNVKGGKNNYNTLSSGRAIQKAITPGSQLTMSRPHN